MLTITQLWGNKAIDLYHNSVFQHASKEHSRGSEKICLHYAVWNTPKSNDRPQTINGSHSTQYLRISLFYVILIAHVTPAVHIHKQNPNITKSSQSPRFQGAYLSPRPRKCCPIRRTMSWSVRDKALVAVDLLPFSMISPLVAVGHSPFCCDVVASSLSPLCCGQPLACMLSAEMRCFLCGGGETPPSSELEDDASIALRHSYGLYWSGNTNHSHYPKTNNRYLSEAVFCDQICFAVTSPTRAGMMGNSGLKKSLTFCSLYNPRRLQWNKVVRSNQNLHL